MELGSLFKTGHRDFQTRPMQGRSRPVPLGANGNAQLAVKSVKPHDPAFAFGPTLVPLQATIRSSCVHGEIDSIDPDQGLAGSPWSHIRFGAGHGYDGAADSRDRGR